MERETKKEETKRAEVEWARVRLGVFEYFQDVMDPEQWCEVKEYLTKLDPVRRRCALKLLFGIALSHREQQYLRRIHDDLRSIERR